MKVWAYFGKALLRGALIVSALAGAGFALAIFAERLPLTWAVIRVAFCVLALCLLIGMAMEDL